MCGVFNHDFCQALQNGIMKHLFMCNIVSVGLVLSLSTISTLAVLLWLQSVQLSDTAMRMISEMLSGQNMFRDDYFDNIYPCIEREEIYSQRDSSKVYKVSQSQAIKRNKIYSKDMTILHKFMTGGYKPILISMVQLWKLNRCWM
mgnify:CR=1 FL=1